MKKHVLSIGLALGYVAGMVSGPVQAATVPTTPGSLVRFIGEPDVYQLINHQLYWIPSGKLFQAASENWHYVTVLPDTVPRPPIGGTLRVYTNDAHILASGSPTLPSEVEPVWLYNVHSQTLYRWPVNGTVGNDPWFMTVLRANGIAPNPPNDMILSLGTAGQTFGTITNPLPVPLSPWPTNPASVSFVSHETSAQGVTYRLAGSPRVYWASGGTLHWIPNPATFDAAGFRWTRVDTVSHLTAPIGYPVLVRAQTAPQVYVEGSHTLHWVPSPSQLTADGFRWADVLTVSHLPEPVGNPWAPSTP
ncbi:hypothetical protein [Sulfobacillus sp. hq2]|uniref:hypothetical protein n=1 Tax=Sulfobacillus TaxID=28033 RepID=UPI000CD195F6|nr:hypothetical protein [Sulfobacillus sp. hq2]POB10451.1 hypothetical protein CO251_10970 [Sulfobacillus sp. hq2]